MKRYLAFFGWYLLVATVGTIIIFALAPILRANISPRTLTRFRETILGTTPYERTQPPQASPQNQTASVPPKTLGDASSQPMAGSAGLSAIPPLIPKSTVTNNAIAPSGSTPIIEHTGPDQTTAASASSSTLGLDYTRMWGVVHGLNTDIFDKTGAAITQADPGTIVEIASVRTSSTDRVAICRIKGRPETDNFSLIRADNLTIRNGTLNSANEALVNLLMRHSILASEIEMQTQPSPDRDTSANPHTAAYRQAREKLKTFLRTAQDLKSKFDGSQGAERAQLVDRLRLMKQDEVLLNQELTESRGRFENWNKAHMAQGNESQEVKNMRAELASINSEIKRIDK